MSRRRLNKRRDWREEDLGRRVHELSDLQNSADELLVRVATKAYQLGLNKRADYTPEKIVEAVKFEFLSDNGHSLKGIVWEKIE